ncbi:MAG: helix-turn-helix transcriptional regulator [Actinomycetota bacterium]|nr:helix-turn-helix transcriptional regulator [Actinomycetota bacterium]
MRTQYRPGQVAELLGVSVDTVRRWADSGKLAMSRSSGGQRVIEGADLARLLVEQAPARPPEAFAQSARNRFPGVVTSVEKDTIMAKVEIQAGPHRVVSLMSAEAADELGLVAGAYVVAVIKATNVIVEMPAGTS